MKVKLLKKIRKRYFITHYPNGVYLYGDFIEGPVTMLQDREDRWRYKISYKVKQQAYKQLYDVLIKWIERDYGSFKSNRVKITSEQLWYRK